VQYEDEIGNKKTLEDTYVLTLKNKRNPTGFLIGIFAVFLIGILGWILKRRREMKRLMEDTE